MNSNKNTKTKRVAVGMSGGVDSSTSAYLLKKQGYHVIGFTLKLFPDTNENNVSKNINDAKIVCSKLNIKHHIIDIQNYFKKNIIDYFIQQYLSGNTPNPCILCNELIKFGILLEKARELNCDYLATGHYAQKGFDKNLKKFYIYKGTDSNKDQSYFLYRLKQNQLSNVLFPLGDYNKTEIKKIAAEIGLHVSDKKESQEICFIYENNYSDYLLKNVANNKIKPGEIFHVNGKLLGKHNGIIHYTVGQRRGLGISYKYPLYVVNIEPEKNRIIAGPKENLFKKETIVKNLNWILIDNLYKPLKVNTQIRYRQKPKPATIVPLNKDTVKIIFNEPQSAITRGQSAVFYNDNHFVIGGGIIV